MRRLALITGGTSGIGLGAAKKLAATHDLALVYASDETRAAAAVETVKAANPECRVVSFQQRLSGYDDAKSLAAEVAKEFPAGPAVLVLSHGRLRDGLFMASEFDSHALIINEHLVANMALAHVFLKGMYRERWGRIIFMSSISATYAKRGQVNYAAAKAGVEAMAKTLALEVAHRGVTVNCIAPGLIETPMTEMLLEKVKSGEVDIKKRVPVGFVGLPEDVAELVDFLASEKSRYITGAVMTIDGGRSLGDTQS